MRLGYYAGASTAAAAACLLKAFHERPNFYSATVYLSQSNACLLILTNLLLVCACAFMYFLQRLLYGPLRPIEIEQLSEKAWYAVLDTLLAMPSFREDVGGWLLTMFVLLLAGKVWGWIGEGRVDILEQQPPANPKLFHARLSTSLVVSVAFNVWMAWYCFETVVANPRPGMMVIFTFEFAIQIVFSMFTLLRYLLAVAEIAVVKEQTKHAIETRKQEIRAERAAARQNETEDGRPAPASPPNEDPIEVDENEVDVPGWEEKRRWLFGLEVITDFLKLVLYIVFFTVSITFNGLPMHIMRDVYLTFASFSKRVADYLNYRKATSDMNTRYPDATTEEIRGDACIVCRENMVAWDQPAGEAQAQPAEGQQAPAPAPAAPARRDEGLRAKKLPCGHILHLRCLKAWLERQQVCPTCRRPVVTATPPAAPGQADAVAPGANGGAPGAQPGQPGGRPGVRARFFNLGPLRIGFANGPPGQMQNLVQQLRNGEGPNPPAAQPAVPQGPNHLGLQEPYAPNAPTTGAAATSNSVRIYPRGAHHSTEISLLQLEQRIMQDAHNLQLAQHELVTLRAMEAELARLRALRIPNPMPLGTAQAAQRMAGNLGVPLSGPQNSASSFDLLRGQTGEQMGSGHEHLPQGMSLPQGWTVMPLQRTQPLQHGAPAASSGEAQAGSSSDATSSAAQNTPASSDSVAQDAGSQTAPSAQTSDNSALGPTDDRGSPLFIPASTATAASESTSSAPPAVLSAAQEHPSQPTTDPTNHPWHTGGWSFGDQHSEQPSATAADAAGGSVEQTAASGSQDGHFGEASHEGKGKGRAVEVEDASDAEA